MAAQPNGATQLQNELADGEDVAKASKDERKFHGDGAF
jgi:hypothetical protein